MRDDFYGLAYNVRTLQQVSELSVRAVKQYFKEQNRFVKYDIEVYDTGYNTTYISANYPDLNITKTFLSFRLKSNYHNKYQPVYAIFDILPVIYINSDYKVNFIYLSKFSTWTIVPEYLPNESFIKGEELIKNPAIYDFKLQLSEIKQSLSEIAKLMNEDRAGFYGWLKDE